jgi:hypothetical protein
MGFRSTSAIGAPGTQSRPTYQVNLEDVIRWLMPTGAFMATTCSDTMFVFDNLDRWCIHAALRFEDLGPRQVRTVVCRLYFARGSLNDFVQRYMGDKEMLGNLRTVR